MQYRIEHRTRFRPGAHRETEPGVLGVRDTDQGTVGCRLGAGEAVHSVQHETGVRCGPAGGEVEHATASHRGQLVPVPH